MSVCYLFCKRDNVRLVFPSVYIKDVDFLDNWKPNKPRTNFNVIEQVDDTECIIAIEGKTSPPKNPIQYPELPLHNLLNDYGILENDLQVPINNRCKKLTKKLDIIHPLCFLLNQFDKYDYIIAQWKNNPTCVLIYVSIKNSRQNLALIRIDNISTLTL